MFLTDALDGATFLDDAPETPAPLFAVRAFKTAIFGTPQPVEYKSKRVELKQPMEQQAGGIDEKANPDFNPIDSQERGISTDIPAQEDLVASEILRRDKFDNHASPTKGILLTPGTATTRRKTVSFSARKEYRDRAESPEKLVGLERTSIISGSGLGYEPPRKQSALTKTLIELSTKRSSPPAAATQPPASAPQDLPTKPSVKDKATDSRASEPIVDLTIDLNQPRSRSGQHWKAEYDEYHRNSTREMKKMIQYGQNVRSYAAKKDYEATTLNEKLQKELAKVARMEAKVSKLAKQLKMANAQGPQGESEQARLIGELAQQTAMVVRYQKKAEHYRTAIRRRASNTVRDDRSLVVDESLLNKGEELDNPFEKASMQAESQGLRELATLAEKRAAKLEDENKRLKRNLSRVKEEMTNYDSRRQAKEERLKKREERHKAAREQCEAELAKLKVEHHRLLQAFQVHGKGLQQHVPSVRNFLISETGIRAAHVQDRKENKAPSPATRQNQALQSSLSPRKRRSQKSAVDIWTAERPNNNPEPQPLPNIEGKTPASAPGEPDTQCVLHEIDQNHTTSDPHPPPPTETRKAQTQPENIRPATKQPSPKRDIADDLMKLPSFRQQLQRSTTGRSASLLGNCVGGSRTNTMGSVRTSSLSAERAAAAKARLAERKRSGEKKKGLEDKGKSLRESEIF